jgi:hypothetical protein
MASPRPSSPARQRLIRGHAEVSSVVDGDALMMFGLFGFSYAIPAAGLRVAGAVRGLVRRHTGGTAPSA